MSAQPGGTILLNYRPQPAQAQAGSAVVLDAAAPAARRLRTGVRAPWVRANAARRRTAAVVPPAYRADAHRAAPWAQGQRQDQATAPAWGVADIADRAARARWLRFERRPSVASTPVWGVAAAADHAARAPWGAYTRRPARPMAPGWLAVIVRDHAARAPWGVRDALDIVLDAPHGPAIARDVPHELPWARFARALNPGWGVITPPNEPPTNEDGSVVVPIRRSYIVVNNVTLVRADNALAIHPLSLRVGIDAGSWGWGWSATVQGVYLADLRPSAPGAPVEVEAQINGVVWRLLVERITRDRSFPMDRLNLTGRGIAAELADPAAPALSRDNLDGAATAQQLAAAALEINGVPIGWTLDWQMADWLVPAGAWVHTGTAMEAVVRIAQSGGGYVQADPLTKTLHVLPRYPVLPWEFAAATPDFILPVEATTRVSTEYIEKPAYNAVYVSGGAVGGVLGQVKRAGSAADLVAEMIVDPLVTHADAARGRGEAVLGDTGPQQMMSVETPVFDEIGLYPVGSLIEWVEGEEALRGLVRGVSVPAQGARVRQVLEVECHE